MRAIHVSREARHRHGLEDVADERGGLGVRDVAAARQAAHRINLDRAAGRAPGPPTVTGGELLALGVLHEVFHRLVERYDEAIAPGAVNSAIEEATAEAGAVHVERTIDGLARDFGRESGAAAGGAEDAAGTAAPPQRPRTRTRGRGTVAGPEADGTPALLPPGHEPLPQADALEVRREALVEGLLLAIVNEDPAAQALRDLFDDRALREEGAYPLVLEAIEERLTAAWHEPGAEETAAARGSAARQTAFDRPLPELLRAPLQAAPTSLAGQLRWIRDHWPELVAGVEGLEDRLLLAADLVAEEERASHQRFGAGGPGRVETPDFGGLEAEPERFSADTEWMPRVVLMAKSTYVWLDQLSRRYGREIRTLDAVPDEELDRLASWGVTALWLIGLWQRSEASARIKHLRGNPDAVASAYSLDDYRIADDLGGEVACVKLRDRAAARGIRLASDMVPNHMGLDSRWVVEHPDRFLSVAASPFPAYAFSGPDLSPDPAVEILLEDHYWDASDAAVVFRLQDRRTGDTRFVYHGNDGTSFPWNDTAQLDYLQAEVREAVIRTILDVARRFPVIRFDAAMVLARRHVRRLWWPEPGSGGGIPSRAEHALTQAAFDAAMPVEFWREVVDRVAAEVPGTLLLAEAFWLMEAYFVRTLGMHRVYNSAFMHMLRDEDNAGYRKLIRETLEFDPEILGRYVNFMTNPDEETAIEQFGTGDKYFGVATLLATLPGLPMVGHGQIEGFTEKYGMEYRRALVDETPDEPFMAYFEAQIGPLFRDRARYAGAVDFRLYDVVAGDGSVLEDVFAYSNGQGAERSLVAFHNRYATADGHIRESVAFADKAPDGSKTPRRELLADALGLATGGGRWLRFRDRRSGLEGIAGVDELRREGLAIHLEAYACLVLDEFREVDSTDDAPWEALAAELGGRWVPSLDDALARLVGARRRAAAVSRARDPQRPLATVVPRLEHRIGLGSGRMLAVAEWGDPDGTPVMLLHGRPGSRLLAPDPATTEALGVRLLTYDRPGYGESDAVPGRTMADGADDLAAIAHALHLERVGVAGWSSGGPFALAAAARHPGLVASVAVIAGEGLPDALPPAEVAASPESMAILEAARRGDPTARDRAIARLGWYADDPAGFIDEQGVRDAAAAAAGTAEPDPDARLRRRPEVLEGLRAHMAEGARHGAAGFADDWLAWGRPWDVDLAAIEAPIDLWWGEADALSPRPHLDTLVRALPGARVHVVADAGHSIAFTHWRKILEALLGPLARRG